MAARITAKDKLMLERGCVPARVCASWAGYAISTIHRAAESGKVKSERVNRLLYVDWDSFVSHVGAGLSSAMPKTAMEALENAP